MMHAQHAEHHHAGHDACAAGGTHGHETPGRIEWDLHRALRQRGSLWGLAAAGGLLVVYGAVLAFANSLEHALAEFVRLWYWMVPLVLGFSVQVGLFAYARTATGGQGMVHSRGVAASGSTSTLGMVACCAHHLTDVLPLIGLAGVAMVLAQYQDLFLLLGVLSNLVGLVYVLGLLHKHGLYPTRTSVLSLCARRPFNRALPFVASASGLVFVGALVNALV